MQVAQSCRWLALIALTTMCVAGCTAEASRYIHFPDLMHPGPAPIQRMQAVQHDPYPLNDVGPEIVGGRPLAYQQSLTEVERAHLIPARPGTVQALPAPGSPFVAPPVVSSPFAVAPPQAAVPLATTAPPIVTGPMPSTAAPYAASSYPAAPAPPVITPYPSATAPVVTSPYPVAPAAQSGTLPLQPRAPY